jgi:hypothetical protein
VPVYREVGEQGANGARRLARTVRPGHGAGAVDGGRSGQGTGAAEWSFGGWRRARAREKVRGVRERELGQGERGGSSGELLIERERERRLGEVVKVPTASKPLMVANYSIERGRDVGEGEEEMAMVSDAGSRMGVGSGSTGGRVRRRRRPGRKKGEARGWAPPVLDREGREVGAAFGPGGSNWQRLGFRFSLFFLFLFLFSFIFYL